MGNNASGAEVINMVDYSQANNWKGLLPAQQHTLYSIAHAESAGGSPAEKTATASVIMNNLKTKGFTKTAHMFQSFNQASPQFVAAQTGKILNNQSEASDFIQTKNIMDNLASNPQKVQPYTNFVNSNQMSSLPLWTQASTQTDNIGRQRYFTLPQNPRVGALQGVGNVNNNQVYQ